VGCWSRLPSSLDFDSAFIYFEGAATYTVYFRI
jgi:hypothetical protein